MKFVSLRKKSTKTQNLNFYGKTFEKMVRGASSFSIFQGDCAQLTLFGKSWL
jgi:hypothetical protein